MNGFNSKYIISLLFIAGVFYALSGSEEVKSITYKRQNPTKTRKKSKIRHSKKSYPKKRSKKRVAKKKISKSVKKATLKSIPKKKGKIVRVYRNLHTGTLSAQEKVGKSWKVTSHPSKIRLKNAKFMVNEGGRQRVLRSGQKNVHAYVQGEVVSNSVISGQKVVYDPYKMDSFKSQGKKVAMAREVSVDSNGNIRAIGIK